MKSSPNAALEDPEAEQLLEIISECAREELFMLCDAEKDLLGRMEFHARFMKAMSVAYMNGISLGMGVKNGERVNVRHMLTQIADALEVTDAA